MAKKHAEKVRARKAPRTQSQPKIAEALNKAVTRAKRPKDQPLPGMEDMRDRVLDRLASGVADERHVQAASRGTEAGYLQAAHRRMIEVNRMVFRAHGVEFIRVPGDEKIRARLVPGGSSEEQPDDTDAPTGVDAADGGGAGGRA